MMDQFQARAPEDTFAIGERIAESLPLGGEVILLYGGLGAGKTLLTKGILNALRYDVDEVTSPSFTLVNLYGRRTSTFIISTCGGWNRRLTRLRRSGWREILENEEAIVIIEWAERLEELSFPVNVISVKIDGDGDEPRQITISWPSVAERALS